MIFIGEMLNFWDNSSLKIITSETEWQTCSHWKIRHELWNPLKLPDIWESCLIMVEPLSHWRETSLHCKMKSNKLVINMSTLKLDIFTSVDHDLWTVWKLKLKETQTLILNIKKCWKKEKVIVFGLNQSNKNNLNKLRLKDMQDSWNKKKMNL